jgi:hypothetical protein
MNARSEEIEMNPMTIAKLFVAFAIAVAMGDVHARDAFDDVKCGGLAANALVGRHLDNGPVEATEKKHVDVGLKHEGSEDVSDSLTYEAWTVCGGSYHLLVRGDVIRSVVRADHSRGAPAFLGTCEADGSPTSYQVFAILDGSHTEAGGHISANDKTQLPARTAWRIDESKARFVETSASHLMCSRQGISTADGGP